MDVNNTKNRLESDVDWIIGSKSDINKKQAKKIKPARPTG